MEQQPLRSTDVRDRNQKLILRLLFQEGSLSQSQVVQKTGLKAPTVFRIFAKLEEDRYIRSCKVPEPDAAEKRERKGRRPAFYCVVPEAAFAVGVDFSTWGVSVIVVNFVNEVIHHTSQEFSPGVRRDEVLSRIGSMIGAALDQCNLDRGSLVGIGIGAPGSVDTESGIVVDYRRIEGLQGFSLKEHFQQLFGVPVYVHNNASVIAASEYHYDSALEYDSVLAVLVRGGVGAAFINHGQIFLNGTTTALELGRTAVCEPGGGESAGGGKQRSLESIAGEAPLLEVIAASERVESWEDAENRLSVDQLAKLLAASSHTLSVAVHNLYHILHPDAVLVISRFEKLAAVLCGAMEGTVNEATVIPITYDPVKACYGATDIVFQRFFS